MGAFKDVLKSLRKSRELTQDGLSEILHISRSAIGMYESGQREPDFETLELIADFFNVDTDYLLGRTMKTTMIPDSWCCQPSESSYTEFLALYHSLDAIDQAKIIERMETMLEADKYQGKDASKSTA